jgi:hypothetical protein
MNRMFVVLAVLAALLAAGCGYVVRFGVPEAWWQDGGATGSGHLISEPLIRR